MNNWLDEYPEKSFEVLFLEKESALEAIWTPKEQIKRKREELAKIFQYDSQLIELKHKLEQHEWEANPFIVDRAKFHFWTLVKLNSWLDNLNFSNPQDINTIFQNFSSNINNAGYFNSVNLNASWRNIPLEKVALDEFILEVNYIINDISSNSYIEYKDKIKEAIEIAEKLLKNGSKYESAIITAENWIQAEWKALSTSLQDKAEIFDTKAEEHNFKTLKLWKFIYGGNWAWLASSITSWILAISLVYLFINQDWTGISVWASLLRISILVIIWYFTFFCLSQFSNNKKLYEIYKFKAIALKTMDELIKSYSEDKDKILDKSISIVFSEPALKDDTGTQQKLLDHLMEIMKKKI